MAVNPEPRGREMHGSGGGGNSVETQYNSEEKEKIRFFVRSTFDFEFQLSSVRHDNDIGLAPRRNTRNGRRVRERLRVIRSLWFWYIWSKYSNIPYARCLLLPMYPTPEPSEGLCMKGRAKEDFSSGFFSTGSDRLQDLFPFEFKVQSFVQSF